MKDLYLTVAELLFEGHENCSTGHSKEKIPDGEPYVVIRSDESANAWRGLNTIFFKGKEIAREIMERRGYRLNGPSVGLYHDAERWLLENLTEVIRAGG